MEDYERFVESRLSQLKEVEEVDQNKHMFASFICFHGRPILPPLLSGPQREEMGRHREAAEKAAEHRKSKNDLRMSYVQTILHSVHVRKTPTLEELLGESDVYTKASSCDSISGSMSHSIFSKDSLSPPFKTTEPDTKCLRPLTSTTCSALLTIHVPLQTSYSERSHIDQQTSDQVSHPSSPNTYCYQSLSSGYVSYTNVENTIGVAGAYTESQKESLFVSDKVGDSIEDFFIHNSSDTVKKMPDIINYPPVDGEELEKSGQASSFSNNLIEDILESAFLIDPSSAEESCGVCPEQKECKETTPSASQSDKDQQVEIKCNLTDQPEDAPASQCLSEIHIQPSEAVLILDEEDSKPLEEPYRMSLQALLKKSQEYRRCQRILRSQAKNAKIQDIAQDQSRVKSQEQSLSDKENDEQHTKGTAFELKKSQEKRDTTVNHSLKRSYENHGKSHGENIFEKSHLTFESKAQDSIISFNNAVDESTKINNWVNTTGPKDFSFSVPIWTENLNKNDSASASPAAFKEVRKYQNIPAPNVCKSPVQCKVKNSPAEPPFDTISQREALINKSINKDHKVEEGNSSNSPLNTVESDVISVFTKSSQHIDQLEFNLSGLKVLISDLESTLTENMDKSSSQSESQQTQLSQNNSVCWLGDDSCSQKSQSPDTIKISNENTLALEQETETEAINLRKKKLGKTMTRREKDHTNTRITTNAQNMRRPPPAKCIISTAQRMRIPDVFRSCLSDATAQHNVSVLSDTSNHPASQKNYADVSHDSRSPSINQSYDVETPSELWLHDGPGSQRCVEKHLTPESGEEGQSSRSKVKRRLQMTEDVQENRDSVEHTASSVRRPSSSTPKAAAQQHEGLDGVKERQKQLRQVHSAQIKALQEEHQRQQEQLLQALAARYRLLQSMSFPCSMSTSHLGDTVTFPTLSQDLYSSPGSSYAQPSSPLTVHYRHLLSAVAKGFLTRRLLKTERVSQLVRTVRDTQQFLQAFKQHSPNKELCSRQDLLLQERVTLQLRAARYEIYDIFFSLSAGERMQLISMDRDLVRERELRRQSGHSSQTRGKSSLSAATQKSLQRKRGLMIQKKTAERHRGAGMRTRHKSGFSADQPLETQGGQFRANPQRIPKSTYTSRPR